MEIEELRRDIDEIDDVIVGLLGRRKAISKEIGLLKKKENLPLVDKTRENELFERLKEKAKEKGIGEELVLKIYKSILDNSRKEQK